MKNQKIIIICLAVLTVIAVVLLIWHPWSPNDNVSTTTKETAGETTGILRDTETTGACFTAGSILLGSFTVTSGSIAAGFPGSCSIWADI